MAWRKEKMSTKVLSVGGSIVAPEYPDTDFVKKFVEMVKKFLEENKNDRLILVVGGGGPARIYQKAFRSVCEIAENDGTDAYMTEKSYASPAFFLPCFVSFSKSFGEEACSRWYISKVQF